MTVEEDDLAVAALLSFSAIQAAIAVWRGRPVTGRAAVWAFGLSLVCAVVAQFPRSVGVGSAQPYRPSIIFFLVSLVAAARARPPWWRAGSVVVHLVAGLIVAHLFVGLALNESRRYCVVGGDDGGVAGQRLWHSHISSLVLCQRHVPR